MSYSTGNDDRNFGHKHYKLNNVRHVVNDKCDMYNNKQMDKEDSLQVSLLVVV